MSLNGLPEILAAEFKADPRKNIYVGEAMLLASVAEETRKSMAVE